MKKIFTLFTILVLSIRGYAQLTGDNYPVQAHVFVQKASLKLPEYFSNSQVLSLDLILKDLTKSTVDVYLGWQITGVGLGIEAGSVPGYVAPDYITLTKGSRRSLRGTDLRDYFRPGILATSGVSENTLFNGKLPEGFYTFKVTAYEAGTGRQVSNTAETFFSVAYALPPVINLPLIGSEQPATRPQSVLLQWMPRHTATGSNLISYRGKVCEVAEDENPSAAITSSQTCFEIPPQRGTSYPLKASDLPLKVGKRYAFQVQVEDLSANLEFQNQGFSEVTWFRFGEACKPPTGLQVNAVAPGRLNVSWNAYAQATGYKLLYRSENQTGWTEQTTLGTSVSLVSLNPELDYEFKVITVCEIGNESPESETVTWQAEGPADQELEQLRERVLNPLSQPVASSGNPGAQTMSTAPLPQTFEDLIPSDPARIPCYSQLHSYEECSDQHPEGHVIQGSLDLPALKAGDLVTIYDYLVVLTQVSGGNNIFSGKGLVKMPFLDDHKMPVEFSNVEIRRQSPDQNGGCVTHVNGYFRVRNGLTSGQIRQEETDLIHTVRTRTDSASIYVSRDQVITQLSEELKTTGKDLCEGKAVTNEARQSLLQKHLLARQGLQEWKEEVADLYDELNLRADEVLSRIQTLISILEANTAIIESGQGCPQNPDIKSEIEAITEQIKTEKNKEPADDLPKIRDVVVKNITDSEATITWKGDKRFTKYLVSYQREGEGVVVKEVSGTELKLTGLNDQTIYNFHITAFDENNLKYDSPERIFQTLFGIFPKPTNLIAVDNGKDQIKITWDSNPLHKKYKVRYIDSKGNENFIYPTNNQTIIYGVKDNEVFEYEVYALNGDGTKTSFEKDSFTSPNICKTIKIFGNSRLVQGESTTLSISEGGLKSVRWLQNGMELSGGLTLTVSPMVTTTYKAICQFETYNNEIITCEDEITVEVLQACKSIEIVSLTHNHEYKKPITLYAKGCVSDIEWYEGLNLSKVLSTATIVEFYSDKDTYYSLKCKDNNGNVCHAKTETLAVGCEMQMAVSYNQPKLNFTTTSRYDIIQEVEGELVKMVLFRPLYDIVLISDYIKFIANGFSSNKKEATVFAYGCPNKLSWDYDKGKEVETGKNYIHLKKVKDTNITAICKKANGQINCTKTIKIEKPANKCKDFRITVEPDSAGIKLSVPDKFRVTWTDAPSTAGNPRVVPIPHKTIVYEVESSNGCTESIGFDVPAPKENKEANLNPIECKPFVVKTGNGETIITRGETIKLEYSGCETGTIKGQVTWNTSIPASGLIKPMYDTEYTATCTIDGQSLTDCIAIQVKLPVFELKADPSYVTPPRTSTLTANNCTTGFEGGEGIVEWYEKVKTMSAWVKINKVGNEITVAPLTDTYFKAVCKLPGEADQEKEVLINVKEIPNACGAVFFVEDGVIPENGYTEADLFKGIEFRVTGCDGAAMIEYFNYNARGYFIETHFVNNHDKGYLFQVNLHGFQGGQVRFGCQNSLGQLCWIRHFYLPYQKEIRKEAESVTSTTQLDGAPNAYPVNFNKNCPYMEGSKTVTLGERGYDKYHAINYNEKNEPIGLYLKNEYCADAGNMNNNKLKGKPFFFTSVQRTASSQVPYNSKTKESYYKGFPSSDITFYGVCIYSKNEYCGFDVTIKYKDLPKTTGQSINLTESDLEILNSFRKINYSIAETEGCPDTQNCGLTNAKKAVEHILKEVLCEKFHYFIPPGATEQEKLDKMNDLLRFLQNSPTLSNLNLNFPEVTMAQMQAWTSSDIWCSLGMQGLTEGVPETVLITEEINKEILGEKFFEKIFNNQQTNIEISTETTPPSCDLPDGSITITATGGTAPYRYSIDGGTTFTPNKTLFDGLAVGNYTIVVKDAEGNTANTSIILPNKEITPPRLEEQQEDPVSVASLRIAAGEPFYFIAPDGRAVLLPDGYKLATFEFTGNWAAPPTGSLQGFEAPDGTVYFAEVTHQGAFLGYRATKRINSTGDLLMVCAPQYKTDVLVASPPQDAFTLYLEKFSENGECGYKSLSFRHNFQPTPGSVKTVARPQSGTYTEKVAFRYPPSRCDAVNSFVKDYAARLAPEASDSKGCIYLADRVTGKVYEVKNGTSTLTALTGEQAKEKVRSKNFDGCEFGVAVEWDGNNWANVEHAFRPGALKEPVAPYTGSVAEVEEKVREAVEKVKQQKGIPKLSYDNELEYEGLDLIRAIIELKNATLELCNNAKVPEKYWKPGVDSPVKAPTLSGVGDGAIEEIKSIPELVGFGLQLATEPETAKALWDGMKSLTPGKVKKMLLGAAQAKLDKYAQGGNVMKHEAGKDGVAAAMFIYGAVKNISTNAAKIADLGDDVVSKLDDIADESLELVSRQIDEPTGKFINKALKENGVDPQIVESTALTIADNPSKKWTFPELQALWKRGIDFNAKARDNSWYRFNEVWLEHPTKVYPTGHKNAGKPRRFRLDSYDNGKIVSRKATTLSDIQQSTFESYLKELVDKYPVGSKIANPNIGTTLNGNYFLEIPDINANFPNLDNYRNIASNFSHNGQTYNIQIILRPE